MLATKSLTEIRGLAQSLGVKDVFQKDRPHLIQEIQAKQLEVMPSPKVEIEKPMYDARLMTKPPSRQTDKEQIIELLQPYILRGLKLSFNDEQWFMVWGKKTDEGSIRMPLRHILECVTRISK